MADTKAIQPEKKEKKKDKKKNKGYAYEEYENGDKFKPVPNPDYNPKLISPFSVNKQEQWKITSSKPVPPATHKVEQQITPAERQGNTAESYFPRETYSHLDPTKSNNSYSAFNELQQKFSPTQIDNKHQQNRQGPDNYKNHDTQHHPVIYNPQDKPLPQQTNPSQPVNYSRQDKPLPQQTNVNQPVKYNPQQQHNRNQPNNQQRRPTHLNDGVKVLSIVRASWAYRAQVSSELSFNANDTFAVINQQPDGWWYAELLDPSRKARGLVPGNYMIPI